MSRLKSPYSPAGGIEGNLYFKDGWDRVRRIDVRGVITTVANIGARVNAVEVHNPGYFYFGGKRLIWQIDADGSTSMFSRNEKRLDRIVTFALDSSRQICYPIVT